LWAVRSTGDQGDRFAPRKKKEGVPSFMHVLSRVNSIGADRKGITTLRPMERVRRDLRG